MRKLLFAGLAAALLCGGALAQDGIYGSFIVGQKFVNLDALSKALADSGVMTTADKFPNNHLTFGGEGHVIGAKRWVLGGKGYLFMYNRTIDSTTTTPTRYLKVIGGVGMGSVGFCIINAGGIHLYPQVGAGVSSFILQSKEKLTAAESSFGNILKDDHMQLTQKVGFITDASVCFDWYLRFLSLFGLGGGPMLHAELGTTWNPANLGWMRDVDMVSGGPSLKFFNPYFNVGIGIGINIEKN